MGAELRRTVTLLVAVFVLATAVSPATAITDEDLRDLRLELQEAVGELDTALWDQRVASDTSGLIQFEFDEMIIYAADTEETYRQLVDAAVVRSLALFNGVRDGTWLERSAAFTYLEASLAADQAAVAAKAEEIGEIELSL